MKRRLMIVLGVMTVGVFCVISQVKGEEVMIESGKTVKFDYTLKVDGQIVDTSQGREPLEYVHGEGKIIPGLASEMEGMKIGDQKTVMVAPKDGYGEINPQAMREFPRSAFPEDINLQPGVVLQLNNPEGNPIPAVVETVEDEAVVLNFNHPLAGKTLEFDVTVRDIQ